MSKRDLLVEFIISDLIAYIIEDENLPLAEAMQRLYSSELYSKISDFETGLYLEGSPYLYEIYKAERENGKLVQLEY